MSFKVALLTRFWSMTSTTKRIGHMWCFLVWKRWMDCVFDKNCLLTWKSMKWARTCWRCLNTLERMFPLKISQRKSMSEWFKKKNVTETLMTLKLPTKHHCFFTIMHDVRHPSSQQLLTHIILLLKNTSPCSLFRHLCPCDDECVAARGRTSSFFSTIADVHHPSP